MLVIPVAFFVWPDLVPVSFFETPHAEAVEPADAIVFLGGDVWNRGLKSLRLLQEGKGHFVLVTGENQCIIQRLNALVPPEKRVVEPAATSTWENARLSYPLLCARDVRSAILVTDWWHTRRALACFRRACPDIKLSVVPARHSGIDLSVVSADARRRECLARLWYALRYGIW